MDWTAVGVMRGRELCYINYKKPGKCTWKIRSRSGRSQGKVREFFMSKSVGTLYNHLSSTLMCICARTKRRVSQTQPVTCSSLTNSCKEESGYELNRFYSICTWRSRSRSCSCSQESVYTETNDVTGLRGSTATSSLLTEKHL